MKACDSGVSAAKRASNPKGKHSIVLILIPRLIEGDRLLMCREGLKNAFLEKAEAPDYARKTPRRAREAEALSELLLEALNASQLFRAAALPREIRPPAFYTCDTGEYLPGGIEDALRVSRAGLMRFRTDICADLSLSRPEDYEGGDTVFTDGAGGRIIRQEAGSLLLYPADMTPDITKVTRGARHFARLRIQSAVNDHHVRQALYDLYNAVSEVSDALGRFSPAATALRESYHRLTRAHSVL